jgi:hypothetical protein
MPPCHQLPVPTQDCFRRCDGGRLGQHLAAQLLSQHRQSATSGLGQPQLPGAELLLESAILLLEVVDRPLQNATKPNRKPRRQELQWQRQHRSAFFIFGPAHGVPTTPSHALRKVAGTLSNCPNPFRFSTILFWRQTRGAASVLRTQAKSQRIFVRLELLRRTPDHNLAKHRGFQKRE